MGISYEPERPEHHIIMHKSYINLTDHTMFKSYCILKASPLVMGKYKSKQMDKKIFIYFFIQGSFDMRKIIISYFFSLHNLVDRIGQLLELRKHARDMPGTRFHLTTGCLS